MIIYNFFSSLCRSQKNQKTMKWMRADCSSIFLSLITFQGTTHFTWKDKKRCHYNQIVCHRIYKHFNQEKETNDKVTNQNFAGQ